MANRKTRRALQFGRDIPSAKHSRLEGVGSIVRSLRREDLNLEEGEVAGPSSEITTHPRDQLVPTESTDAPPDSVLVDATFLPAPLAETLRSFAPDFASLIVALYKCATKKNSVSPRPLNRKLSHPEAAFLRGLRAYLANRRLPVTFLDAYMPF